MKILWRIKAWMFGIMPEKCPYCGGQVIEKGFRGHNWRLVCKKCKKVLVDEGF